MIIIVIIDHDNCNRTNAIVDFRFLAKSISLALLARLWTMAEHSFEQNFIWISHLQGQDNETLLLLILGKGSIENRDDKRVYYTFVKQMLQALTFG